MSSIICDLLESSIFSFALLFLVIIKFHNFQECGPDVHPRSNFSPRSYLKILLIPPDARQHAIAVKYFLSNKSAFLVECGE